MFLSSIKSIAVATVLTIAVSGAVHAEEANAQPISITDSRTSDQVAARRDSIFSAIAFLPDKAVKPSPVEQLQLALQKHAGSSTPLQLTIHELRVIDYFPHRIKAGPGTPGNNWLMETLVDKKTDWSFVQDMQIPDDQDSVICLLVGTLNGVEVKAFSHSPYRLSGFSMMVRSDKNFKAAVSASIDQVVQKIIAGNISAQTSP